MIDNLIIFESTDTNPYRNIAIEQYLLNHVDNKTCILYLWQNANTVVIGRNQNAWAECRTSLLAEEGGHLARRLSGGGAVFHDLGNLNFTFLVAEENFDTTKQLSVIQKACKYSNIDAVFSGRNDLLTEERKFSGNAFYHAEGKAYHHGTLLIHADMDKMTRYLSPPKSKLTAKGVSSVRSRVINLSEIAPDLTCDLMRKNLKAAFSNIYGLKATTMKLTTDDEKKIRELQGHLESQEWLFGAPLPCSISFEERFPWGNIQFQLGVNKGLIHQVKVYTDAIDWSISSTLEIALSNCKFRTDAILCVVQQLTALPADVRQDISDLIKMQEL